MMMLYFQSERPLCTTPVGLCPIQRKKNYRKKKNLSNIKTVQEEDSQEGDVEEQSLERLEQIDIDEQEQQNDFNSDTSDSDDTHPSIAAELFTAEHERQLQEETFSDTSSEYDDRFWHEDVFWDAPDVGELALTPSVQSPDINPETQAGSDLKPLDSGSVRTYAAECKQEASEQESINNDPPIRSDEVSLPEENQRDILLPNAEPVRPISQEDKRVQRNEAALPATDNTIAPWAQAALEKQTVIEAEVELHAALYDEIDELEAERTVREALSEDEEKNVKFKPINEFGPQKKELSELDRYFLKKRMARFLNEQLDVEVEGSLKDINKQ